MAISKLVSVLLGLMLSSSVLSEQMYSPICYHDKINKREVVLLGVNHFLRYQPHSNGIVENLVNNSNLVFFENTEVLPRDGVFRLKTMFPERAKQPIRLDRFIDAQDIPKLSQLFGTPFSPEMSIPLGMVSIFVESILAKKLVRAAGDTDSPQNNSLLQMDGSYNVESAAYAYALSNNVQTHDLETISEMLGVIEFPAIKREIGNLIECAQNSTCVQEYKTYVDKRNTYLFTDAENSYEYIYQLSANALGFVRTTMIPKNERMAHQLLTSLSRGNKALVIVGASHIGGPIGLASKLESAGFIKVKCKP